MVFFARESVQITMNHDWFPEMIHQSHFPSPPPFQKTEPWRTSSHFLHKETTLKILSTKKCTIFNPRKSIHFRSSPAQRDRHQSISSVGWMTSWLSLGSARPCDLCTVPKTWGKAAGSRKCDLDKSNLSPFKKIHLEKNPIGFRGRNEIPLLVLEASQVEGRMKEQQRFLFSRQSLCFLVGEKETMKLMIHFWADSLDSLIVHKSWANFILATSAEVTKWWLKTSQLQKLVDGQSTNLSSYNSSH